MAPIGFGCAQLFRLHSAKARESVLAAAYDSGIRHYDVAPLYGLGQAEEELGRFLRGRREQVTVTTKFGLDPAPGVAALRSFQGLARRIITKLPAVKRYLQGRRRPLAGIQAFDAKAAERSLERSLRLLQVDYIDYFLLHEPTVELVDRDRPMDFLRHQQDRFRIRAFGVAGSHEALSAVISRFPSLAAVVQHPAPPLGSNPTALAQPPAGVSFVYGSVAPRIRAIREKLNADPKARDAWVSKFGEGWERSHERVARLLLLEQQITAPGSTILFGTTSPVHVEEMSRSPSLPEHEAVAWIRKWAVSDDGTER